MKMLTPLMEPATDDDGWVVFSTVRLRNGTTIVTEKRDGCTRVQASGPIPQEGWPWQQ